MMLTFAKVQRCLSLLLDVFVYFPTVPFHAEQNVIHMMRAQFKPFHELFNLCSIHVMNAILFVRLFEHSLQKIQRTGKKVNNLCGVYGIVLITV